MVVGGSADSKPTKLAVYAIGGNALSNPQGGDERSTAEVLAKVMSDIVDLLESGYSVVVTHGNGPQVGDLLLLEEKATATKGLEDRSRLGMDYWVSATQGIIGHGLSLNLDSILQRRGRPERTAVILTRVEVDPHDPAFSLPSKPIGPVLNSHAVMSEDWDIASTKKGPRRVVASPAPKTVLDSAVIKNLVEAGAVVICGGGGGIPVVRKGDHWVGVPAVVDKDHLSSLLATDLCADALIISTAIDSLRTGFGTSSEKVLTSIACDDALQGVESGEFPAGSMGPKVEALVAAKRSLPDAEVVLCQPGDALAALRADAGTTFL